MFIDTHAGAIASTLSTEPIAEPESAPSANLPCLPAPQPEQVRHLLFGTPNAVQVTIRQLHQRSYAEVNDWSRLISTGRANEVMAILTKRAGS